MVARLYGVSDQVEGKWSDEEPTLNPRVTIARAREEWACEYWRATSETVEPSIATGSKVDNGLLRTPDLRFYDRVR